MAPLHKETILHQQIKDQIIKQIKSGEYPVQSQLPTEAEFCDTYLVSRTTIRAALQQLSQEGYVYRRQGRGTFVAEPKIKTSLSQTITSFNEQLTSQGKQPQIKVLSLQLVPADEQIATILKTEANAPVYKLVRLRFGDNKPLQYETAFLPWSLAPGLTETQCQQSLYTALRTDFQVHIARTEEQLQLATMEGEVCEYMQCEEHTPCIYLETSAFLKDGTIAEYSQTYFHGERASFQIERVYE